MDKAKSQKQQKFTTGLLAQVWQVDRSNPGQGQAETRLVQIEYRIERAKRVLQQIEQRANEAVEDLENTERRFETLRDSFSLLQQEWKNWKKEQDQE